MPNKINLFSIPIVKTKIIPAAEEYKSLDDFLNSKFENTNTNVWASETGKSTGEFDLFLHKNEEMNWLVNSVLAKVFKFWDDIDYAHGAIINCCSSWANLHTKNQVTGEHSHCDGSEKSHISAVYYFKKPPKSGNIEFRDPLEYIHSLTPRHLYNDEITSKAHTEIEADEFDLILFPSWLKHRTQLNNSSEDRVAISMNFRGEW